MEHDKLTAAVARYQAMAGLKQKLPPGPRAGHGRTGSDMRRHTCASAGKLLCEPVRMVRFLVDVCGLTMQEASKATRAALRHSECGAWPGAQNVEAMAAEIYRRTGDMADAMSMARFLGWSSDQPQVWEAVRMHLARMRVTREATGIENWMEAAE